MRVAVVLIALLPGACAGQPGKVAPGSPPHGAAQVSAARLSPTGIPLPTFKPSRAAPADVVHDIRGNVPGGVPGDVASAAATTSLVSPEPTITRKAVQVRFDAPGAGAWPEPAAGPGAPPPIRPPPARPDDVAGPGGGTGGPPDVAATPDPRDRHPDQTSVAQDADGTGISVSRGSGQAGEALTQRVWVTDRTEDLRAASRAAVEALRARDGARALAIYQEILTLLPGERSTLLGTAAALRLLDRPAEAERVYLRLLRKNPDDRFVEVALWGLRSEREPQEALSQLRRMAWQDPDDGRVRAQIGMILARHGHLDRAIAELQVALRLDPANDRYRVELVALGEARRRGPTTENRAAIGAQAPPAE